MDDNVSIIIRNRNENEFIGFAIQSCLDHFNKPEIIIVDNNSTDDSLHTVNLFKDRTTIKIVPINDYTPGKSINLGAKHATKDTILVLSAHAQITKVDLKLIELNLTPAGSAVAVFGQQTPIYKGKKISKRYIWSHFKEGREINMFSKIENRQFLHNAFCFYNRPLIPLTALVPVLMVLFGFGMKSIIIITTLHIKLITFIHLMVQLGKE